MTGTLSDVLVVGASTAGLATAEALRDRDPRLSITVIGDEPHLPYRRPALSKQVLSGRWSATDAALTSRDRLADARIQLLTGVRATGLDLADRVVHAGDREHRFGRLVIATGSTARPLDGIPRARSFRTLDDAATLRDELVAGVRVAIVGGGVLACELAAACRERGAEVVLLSRGGLRLGATGDLLARPLRALLEGMGVVVREGAVVSAASIADGATELHVSDGTTARADVVVGAIGCDPAIEWLRGTGLDLRDGVVCDANGCAAADVYAVGDVARWGAREDPAARRVEHQTSAIEQAHAVAAVLTGGEPEHPGLPFFWSELGPTRVQALGSFPEGVELRMLHDDADRFVAVAETADGIPHGLIGWNAAREFRAARALLAPLPHVITKD